MDKLHELLTRYRKAEVFFASDEIAIEDKLKHTDRMLELGQDIEREYKRLGLDTDALRNEMLKAGIQCE